MVYVSKYWQIFKNNPENLKYELIIYLRLERIYVDVRWWDFTTEVFCGAEQHKQAQSIHTENSDT